MNDIGMLLCFGVPVAVIVIILVIQDQGRTKNRKALGEANAAYQASLQKLKINPNNADLKQRTLELGRAYSALTRENKAVTVYDEMALSNDISAATAGATSNSAIAVNQSTIEERLRKLDELRSKGIISEQEHASRRQQILSEV